MEFDFIREGMRHDQRERQGFLGFALAASGVVLGLLMRSEPPHSSKEACFLVGLAAGVTLIAELMTIRASQGVASAGAYIRLFIESEPGGLKYQGRNKAFLEAMKGKTSASRGLGYAYIGLTAAFVAAWWAAPAHGRQWWQTSIVVIMAAVSLFQAGRLMWASRHGWPKVDAEWKAVADAEKRTPPGD